MSEFTQQSGRKKRTANLLCYKRDRPINRLFCRELHLALIFPRRLQKDPFKGKWSLAKSYFKQNYKLHSLHFLPVPLRELVRPSLACTDVPLPQKKIDFFLREGDVCTQAGSSFIFLFV